MDKVYHWRNFKVEQVMPEIELERIPNGEISSFYRAIYKKMVLEVQSKVLVEDMTNRRISQDQTIPVEYHEPTSTWQFFKRQHEEDWWMRWLVKNWPVRTRIKVLFKHVSCFHSINPMYLFPECSQVPKDFGRVVRYVDIQNGGFRVYDQAADYRQIR